MRYENVIKTSLNEVPESLFRAFDTDRIDGLRATVVLARLLIDRKPFTRQSLAESLGTSVPKVDRALRLAKRKGWVVQHPTEYFTDDTGKAYLGRKIWEIREPA